MLPPGARIAVVSPSGQHDPARLESGLNVLREWGYAPVLLPHSGDRWRYLAGTDDARLSDLQLAFSGSFDAVWLSRGGYGLARLLPRLDVSTLAPVPFLGFSDATAALNHFARLGRPAVHAPVLHSLADLASEATRNALRTLLRGDTPAAWTGRELAAGVASGPMVGGNLCVLAAACGTPFQLDAQGAIVVLEDLGEVPYKLDRLLTQCIQAGAFAGAVGFALGEFLGAAPPADADWTLDDIFRDTLGPLGVPVIAGVPVGHAAENHAWRLRAPALLEAGRLHMGIDLVG